MTEEELLNAGISAAKSGDRAKATALFAQLVKVNASSEQGWFYLGICCVEQDQREYCFRRVLAINPKHTEARQQLEKIQKPAATPPPPAWASQPPPVNNTPVASAPPKPSTPAFSPFKYEYDDDEEVEPIREEERPLPVVFDAPATQKIEEPKAIVPAKKKKSNLNLILALLGIPILIVCVSVGAYLLFPGEIMQLMSPSLPNGQGPVALSTQTLPATIENASPTPLPATSLPSPMPTVTYTPKYEETSCWFETPPDVKVTCGYATVPEDRTGNPEKTIKLAVAVFHSTSQHPAADPVMFLQGGPGGEAVQLSADAFDFLVAPFLSTRDYVTFDQRGTGLSEPALKCDELDHVYRQDIYGGIPIDTRELVYKNAFLSCEGLLRVSGINLNSYTTVESANDLKDIVQLLGYEKVDLYGASYGTRLALVTMRDHPEIVRSAILDSVVPVEANVFSQYPDAVDSALSQLFNSCAADEKCNTAYPNLKDVFWEAVKELDAKPVTVTTSAYPIGTVTESVDGSYLMSVILGLIKTGPFIDTAPQTIYRVKGKDYSTLLAAQYSLPFAFDGIDEGLYISMMCHEHALAATQEQLQASADKLGVKKDMWPPYYGGIEVLYSACKSWGSTGPYLDENAVVTSDIPSLVIEGSFDPATPPFYGKQVAEKLSKSFYVEFSDQGHVPTAEDSTGCAMDLAVAFIDNPADQPDESCLDALPKVKFLVPYTGDPPLDLQQQDFFGVTMDAPKDWLTTPDGFLVRNDSPFDITQIGALRARLSADELKDYFSLSAYGYRGLDGAPVESGTVQANGLEWKLYIALSNGRPVDIAIAPDGRTSLIIMMFSHPDEHDALYRTVFLPIVNSAH